MKNVLALSITLLLIVTGKAQIGSMLKSKVQSRVQNEESNQMDKGLNKAEGDIKDTFKKKKKNGTDTTKTTTPNPSEATDNPSKNSTSTTQSKNSTSTTQIATTEAAPLKVYQNYDFVPGEQIIFEDNFADDQDGEFAAHWKLNAGQAVVNKVAGKTSFLLTEGNYAEVMPRIKTEKYLSENFTIEFDFIFAKGSDGGYSYQDIIKLYYVGKEGYETSMEVTFGMNEVRIDNFSKSYPPELTNGFADKWHHASLVLKNGQMKTYVDQYRVCINPNIDQKFDRLTFDGIGSEVNPIVFSNVKIANGGGMNLIGKKFTDAKIVTHGITFDVNRSTIKPESMGTLNMILKVMQENPELKFEIDGHTDSDGNDADNLKLSQARAGAVKAQLVTMGITADRLSTKGFGETKPISENDTPEGKANNRRVEFVKQ